MSSKNRFIFFMVVLITGALSGCKKVVPDAAASLTTVRVVTAALSKDDKSVHYSVSLIANRQADIAFKSSGIVDQIRMIRGADGRTHEITMGDTVKTGDLLARVRAVDYQQKVDQAQAELSNATAQREGMQASLTLAESNYLRAGHLYAEQSLTRQDYERAQQQRDSALAAAHQSDAEIENAKAEIAQTRLALSDTALRAPFWGAVVARRIESGDLAGASATAFTIADIAQLKANFIVPDTALNEVPIGRQLNIRLGPDGRDRPARITAVSPSADPQSRVFTVELTIANPGGELRPGMIGSIELFAHLPAEPHIAVPISSLVQAKTDHEFALFVVDGSAVPRVHLRPVKIGTTNGNSIQILSGLAAGERVISVGAQILHDNDTVRVIE